ncbi:CopG family transcriptional regulator [Komagataeibacter swingsii]|uniref:CopG family transcriptional regulator n=1 Tax=Komagataeibacter swingsii TaxID=215220 RepID=A0A2V4S9V0_9PROT|nr:CopG family transcriptional regulator [Komagataeibacter swingsii]
MSKLNEPKKKRGRPPVESEQLRARAEMPLVRAVDAWARRHNVTRAEAVRRLIGKGLSAFGVSDSEI